MTADSTTQPASETMESSSFDNVPWPVRPSPGINYNFVSMMYLGGSAIALMFYALEKQILAPLLVEDEIDGNNLVELNQSSDAGDAADADEGGDPWKEFAKGMEGMYLIFAPFIPCLLWSLVVRHYWLKETKVASQEKKQN